MQDRKNGKNTPLSLPVLKPKKASTPAITPGPNYLKDILPPEMLFHVLEMLSPEDIIKLESVEKFFTRSSRISGVWNINNSKGNIFWHQKCLRHFPNDFSQTYDDDVYYFEEFKKTYTQHYEKLPIKQRKLFSYVKEGDVFSLRKPNYTFTLNELACQDKNGHGPMETWAVKLNNQLINNRLYEIAQAAYIVKNNQIDGIDINKKLFTINATIMFFAILLNQSGEIAPLVARGCDLTALCGKLSPIQYAAIHGRVEIANNIIDINNKALDQADSWARTPLFFAVMNNKPFVVEALIKHGAKLNEIYLNPKRTNDEHNGKTALYYAVEKGYTDVAVMLAKAGADAAIKPQSATKYAIHLAADAGNLEIVKALLQTNPSLLNQTDACQQTALAWAAVGGHTHVINYLLSFWRVSLNTPSFYKNKPESSYYTALHVAVYYNHRDAVAFLVIAGAKLKIANGKGNQPIHTAVSKSNIAIAKILLDKDDSLVNETNKEGFTPIMLAVINQNEEMLALLLQYQPNLSLKNEKDTDAQAIHYAAAIGSLNAVKMILKDYPSSLNAKDKFGRTPLMHAAMCGNNEIINFLIGQNVEINEKSTGNTSALDFATQNGHLASIKLLLQHQAIGNTLHAAAEHGQLKIVKELLNAKPESRDETTPSGDTPLIVAVRHGNLEVVTELLIRKAKIDIRNNAGESALYLAAKLGHSDIVNALLNDGAQIDPNTPVEKNLQLTAEAKAKLQLAEYIAVRPTQPLYKTCFKIFGFEFNFGSSRTTKMKSANAMSAHFFANKGGKVELSGYKDENEKQKVKKAMKKGDLGRIYNSLKLAQRG